jgi:hypothetical protein
VWLIERLWARSNHAAAAGPLFEQGPDVARSKKQRPVLNAQQGR